MTESSGQHRRFGNFRLDIAERLLTGVEQPIALPPKAFDLLILLVSNPGRLLAKQRIMDALWPDTFVEEANLANLIALLRRALGDSTRQPTYIETVPKLGYRFIAEVSQEGAPTPRAAAEPPHPAAIRFIAFPFRNDGAVSDDFLAYSFPEAIAATLAELNAFTVRSTRMAARFDPVRWDPAAVAAQADVDVILSGTISRAEGQIHAATELIDAPSATVLWSKVWHVPATELHHLHQGIVQLIIRSVIRRTQSGNVWNATDNPSASQAYELYLRANELALKRSPENMALARDLYVACTEIDPNYAPAWARLGRCFRWLEKFNPSETSGSAEAAFARAFQLNPHLGIAHSAYTPMQCDAGKAPEAIARLIGALKHNESNPEIFSALVHACRYCGLLDASVAAHMKAVQLDRNLPTSVAHTYFALGEYEKTLHWYDTKTGMYLDVLALAMMERTEDASALLWTRRERFNMSPAAMNSLRHYLDGDAARGIAALKTHAESVTGDPEMTFYMARQAAKFGDAELALRFLSESVTSGYGSSSVLKRDPWLGSLQQNAEFMRLLAALHEREGSAHKLFLEAGGEHLLGSCSFAAPTA